jgi:hypothetical protein
MTQPLPPNALPPNVFDSRAAYVAGLDQVLAGARRELRIFDPDLSLLDLEAPARAKKLEMFLRQGSWTRLWIVLHRLDYAERNMPRLLNLQRRFAQSLTIRLSDGEGRRAEDCFVLADAQHVVRRAVAEQSRGVLRLNDPSESGLLRERFDAILAGALPGIEPGVSGL